MSTSGLLPVGVREHGAQSIVRITVDASAKTVAFVDAGNSQIVMRFDELRPKPASAVRPPESFQPKPETE